MTDDLARQGDSQHRSKLFFVSRAGPDREIGKMVASWLEAAGHDVFIQDWDIEPGEDFLSKIHESLVAGAHVIALLSPDYLTSRWCKKEWNAAVKAQEDSGRPRLLPLRIRDCHPDGLMNAVVYVDLVGTGEETARHKLLQEIQPFRPRTGGSWMIPASLDRPRITNLDTFDVGAFAGRTEELELISKQLSRPSESAVAITALSGLGGVGKSALARAFCAKHFPDYEVIWWVRSEKKGDLETDLAKLALELDPGASDSDTPTRAKLAVEHASRWAGRRPFLLVFDNASNPSVVRPYRPAGASRTIVTSRNTSWSREWNPITVRKLDPDVAAQLLLKATSRNDYDGARALAVELDGLALPLTHAAAILRENATMTFSDLVRRFDLLMTWQTEDEDVRCTYATYTLAIEQLAKHDPLAQQVMSLAAYCAPEAIPSSFIEMGVELRLEGLSAPQGQGGQDRIRDTLGYLSRYALIDVDTSDGRQPHMSVHRVVQRVVRKQHLDSNEAESWGCLALRSIDEIAPHMNADAVRHAREALTSVPQEICKDVRARLDKLIARPHGLEPFASVTPPGFIYEAEVEAIRVLFAERNHRVVAILGAGGTGKTSLARVYSGMFRSEYSDVWILYADGERELFEQLRRKIFDTGVSPTGKDVRSVAREALDHPSIAAATRPLLVVIDGLEDPTLLDAFPLGANARLLVCSRTNHRLAGVPVVELRSDLRESMRTLSNALPSSDATDLAILARTVGQSPLLIAATIRAIADGGASAHDLAKSISDAPGVDAIANKSHFTHRLLSPLFKQQSPLARELLQVMSVFGWSGAPVDALTAIARRTEAGRSENVVRMEIESLKNSRLVVETSDAFGPQLTLAHATLREIVDDSLSGDAFGALTTQLIKSLVDLFHKRYSEGDWSSCERVVALADRIATGGPYIDPATIAQAWTVFGRFVATVGDHAKAVTLLTKAIEAWSKAPDRYPLERATTFDELAQVLLKSGDVTRARDVAEASLVLKHKAGASSQGLMARSLETLAELHLGASEFDAAEARAREALHLRSLTAPENKQDRLPSLNLLTEALIGKRNVTEAYDPAQEALSVSLLDGEESAGSLIPLANLATLKRLQGNAAECEILLRRALELNDRLRGPDHHSSAPLLRQLSSLYEHTGRHAEAERVIRHALTMVEGATGKVSTRVVECLLQLGRILVRAARWDEADTAVTRALRISDEYGSVPARLREELSLLAHEIGVSR